jgi:hypothetical protein
MNRSLSDLLARLPPMDKDGYYFELRKMERTPPEDPCARFVEWKCAKTNNTIDDCSNIGATPEEAVEKMLRRLEIDIRDPHAACMDACETAYIRLLQLPHEGFRSDPRTQEAMQELCAALALAKGLTPMSAMHEYTDMARGDDLEREEIDKLEEIAPKYKSAKPRVMGVPYPTDRK